MLLLRNAPQVSGVAPLGSLSELAAVFLDFYLDYCPVLPSTGLDRRHLYSKANSLIIIERGEYKT